MFLIFPYRIERPYKMPWATVGIIATCTLVFLLQAAIGLERSYALLGFRPNAFGAITWLTSMFAHAGVMHLAGNMYFLWVFGGVLEDAIGRTKYLMLYLAGGIVAALAHTLMMIAFSPEQVSLPLVGASGAIAAIMGVSAVRFYKLKLRVWYFFMVIGFKSGTFSVTAAAGLAVYFLRELYSGVVSLMMPGGGVAYWAHIFGIIFGVGVAYAFGLGKELQTEEARLEAQTWAALGRHDVASAVLASAPTVDPIEAALNQVRAALHRPVPDTAAAGADVSNAVRELVRQGRREAARDAYREFGAFAAPQPLLDASALASIGAASEALGDWDAAAHAYYDIIRLHNGALEAEKALYRLAHVYLAQGKHGDAAQTWAAFLQYYPLSQWRGYADQRLEASA